MLAESKMEYENFSEKEFSVREYELATPPVGIEIYGTFANDCMLKISETTYKAIKSGALKLKFARFGLAPSVSGAKIEIFSTSGSIIIRLGGDGAVVSLGENTSGIFELRLWRDSSVRIDSNTTSNGAIVICDRSDVSIGYDSMLSDGILIQSADQHGIVDLATGGIINDKRRATSIGSHVWLGRNSTILPDVEIGEGSIIGAGAVVTKSIPAFAIAAGVPAKVIRERSTWSRAPDRLDVKSDFYIRSFHDQPEKKKTKASLFSAFLRVTLHQLKKRWLN